MNPNTGALYENIDVSKETANLRRERPAKGTRSVSISPISLMRCTPQEHDELKPMTTLARKGWARNKPCPCGETDKKYKNCCWHKHK